MNLFKLSILIFITLFNATCEQVPKAQKEVIANFETKKKSNEVSKLKITCLSTMLANQGIGEWGYAALVEVDGKKILFDTGRFPETVLQNAAALGIDLSDVENVFLSHNHGDHTGGLLTLRAELKKQNPKALSKIHVGKGIFQQRINARNRMQEIKEELELEGVEFFIYEKEVELFPGVWITGPIERIHDEKNYGGGGKIATEQGTVVDNIPEDQSLVIDTDKGFVMISGCGHAGMINTMEQINSRIHQEKVYAVIGGFHLVNATDEHLKWTAKKMKDFGVTNIIGAHCTGIHALYTLKEALNLDRASAVVGSVGDHFDLENGIRAGIIAR
ncbi:MAG TPA: MBL fold metallo-hydrolase [Saprospiraceae bacterium]|nr:MBL fold metallo-hydrolase [Saprospiraceae bacterium]